MRRLFIASSLLGLSFCLPGLTMGEVEVMSATETDVEAAVCGSFREPLMFWLWQHLAGTANPQRVANIKNAQQIRFTTRDGITLGGYKLAADNPNSYLLVAPGNAMLADRLVADLQTFRDRGWDVYIYDYRGYGISQGKSRLAAIVTLRQRPAGVPRSGSIRW